MTELAIAFIIEGERRQRPLVARVVNQLVDTLHPVAEAHLRQPAGQEPRAARDMIARELRAIGGFEIAALAQVSHVVEQRRNGADRRPLGAKLQRRCHLGFVADHQPRHRQRDVEGVLGVVIQRIDADVLGASTREHVLEPRERGIEGIKLGAWPDLTEQLRDRHAHRSRRAHLYGVRDVEVAAPGIMHRDASLAGEGASRRGTGSGFCVGPDARGGAHMSKVAMTGV